MPKILAIDDESNMLDLIRAFLSMDQHTVETAQNGEEALRIAREFLPDLILCDVMMPDMDGYTVLSQVQDIPELKGIPFVFLTGLGDMDHLRQGMNSGADDYLTKPFTYKDISQAIKIRLDKREAVTEQVTEKVSQEYTEKLASADHKLHMALYRDELTGLPNARQLDQDFGEALNQSQRVSLLVALPDQWANFEAGHSDPLCHVLLKNMANRLKSAFKEQVYRVEDSFVVLVSDTDGTLNYQFKAQRLMGCFNESFSIMGQHFDFTSSVGIAHGPEHSSLCGEVFKAARRTREQLENTGGNQWAFFEGV